MLLWSNSELGGLIPLLKEQGYRVIGPLVRDGAMVFGDIERLPIGWGDEQEAGRYRLIQRGDQTRFGYNLGPSTWKQFLFPPVEELFSVADNLITPVKPPTEKLAFIGVRACELAAIKIQDKVFTGEGGGYRDVTYSARRENVFLVAVNCSQAAPTCFCTANDDGPAVGHGADMVLTEVNPDDPKYLVELQSDTAKQFFDHLSVNVAAEDELRAGAAAIENARHQISRHLERRGLRDELVDRMDNHPHWDDVAARCLGCGNCTQVCPTCFCSSSEEQIDPVSLRSTHLRKWDSCFNTGHSYMTGGPIRAQVRSRYRQWLTHKLATWEDQFGVSGCTGCGRCISWCPVGIDLTQEVAHLKEDI